MIEKKENLHKNHRKRLKDKVKKFGLECLAYHEILELLLTYTIPRRDTNPIAHNLIEHFGSFSSVVDADYEDLLKVDGVGPESALFISILSQCMEAYNKNKSETKTSILTTTSSCVQFFRDYYRIKNNEFMVMACLGKSKKVIKTYLYKGRDETEVSFDVNQIAKKINDNGVKSVILYHTHPHGSVEPSYSDFEGTQSLINLCLTHGIDFEDHIILNECEHYSFKSAGKLQPMKEKYFNNFSVKDVFYEKNKK